MGSGNCQSQGQAGPYKHPENITGVVGAGTDGGRERKMYMGRNYTEPETPD